MDSLLGLLGSVFSGGATGLLGVVAQRFADYKNRQLEMALEKQRGETEIAKRKADQEIMATEYAGKLKVAQEEGATARDVAESKAFEASVLREPERYSAAGSATAGQNWLLVLLDVLRGSVRPLLTIYLCALTTYVWFQVRTLVATEDLQPQDVLGIWTKVVDTILYLFTTCTLWYFGTRNKQQPPK